MTSPKISRVGVIACEIFFREVSYYTAASRAVCDVVWLPKGLHDRGGDAMRAVIQQEVNRMHEREHDRIVLAYGLCNNGITGLTTSKIPLVVPRAHDCITLFLGSRKAYHEFFHANPGTYFHTAGWIERGAPEKQYFDAQLGPGQTKQDYIEKYGEENGSYLWEMLDPRKNYHRIAYINVPIPGIPDAKEMSRRTAEELGGWEWIETKGSTGLFERLLDGPYDDDFIIINPGETVISTHDEKILGAKKTC